MLIHIVRHNEKLSDILTSYNVSYDELKVNNLHISNLNNLLGGMKLKIPFLKEETLQILESTEPFISDYYPSVNKIDEIVEIPNENPNVSEERLIDEISANNNSEEEASKEDTKKEELLKEDSKDEEQLKKQPTRQEKVQEEILNQNLKPKQNIINYHNNHQQFYYPSYERRSIYPFYKKDNN